jgi:hypothetical protein
VALCQARISTKPLWGFSSSNPYHSQSRAEQSICKVLVVIKSTYFRKHGTKVYDFSAKGVKHIRIPWIGIKMVICVRIRISIKTMPIHHAA